MYRGAKVAGRVVEGCGRAVVGDRLTQAGNCNFGEALHTETDAERRFSVDHNMWGVFTLIVQSEAYAPTIGYLSIAENVDNLLIELEPGHTR